MCTENRGFKITKVKPGYSSFNIFEGLNILEETNDIKDKQLVNTALKDENKFIKFYNTRVLKENDFSVQRRRYISLLNKEEKTGMEYEELRLLSELLYKFGIIPVTKYTGLLTKQEKAELFLRNIMKNHNKD